MAGLIEATDVIYQPKYVVSQFNIVIGSEIIKIEPYAIGGITIENDYENAIHPIFKMTILTTSAIIRRMLKEKSAVKYIIRIQKYELDVTTNKKGLYKDYITGSFVTFMGEADSDISEDFEKSKAPDGKISYDPNKLDDLTCTYDLLLFKESNVNGLQKSFNMVVQHTNVTQMLTYLFYVAGLNNVLMTPLQNATQYDAIVFPPQTILRQIFYLDRHYGLYKRGAMIYFALERAYVLNLFAGRCSAWVPNEYKETTIMILKKGTPNFNTPAMIKKTGQQKFYINVNGDNAYNSNDTYIANVTGGVISNTINANSNTISKDSRQSLGRGPVQFEHVIYNDTPSSFVSSTYAQQQSANVDVLDITMSDIDPEALWPNKLLNVVYEDTKLNTLHGGYYAVSSVRQAFNKEGDEYRLTIMAKLKKFYK